MDVARQFCRTAEAALVDNVVFRRAYAGAALGLAVCQRRSSPTLVWLTMYSHVDLSSQPSGGSASWQHSANTLAST